MRILVLLFFGFLLSPLGAFEWQAGDVIVQSFDCMECRLIQSETNSPYVHSGIVVRDERGEFKVAEALGPVGLTSLSQFLGRGKINTVYRAREFEHLNLLEKKDFEDRLLQVFLNKFAGLSFDSAFLWDNFDKEGHETLYCAEFVAKLLNQFLIQKMEPQPMSYKKHYEIWMKIFKGKVPEGLPGLSPSSFTRSELFLEVR